MYLDILHWSALVGQQQNLHLRLPFGVGRRVRSTWLTWNLQLLCISWSTTEPSSSLWTDIPEVVHARPTHSQYMEAVDTIRLYSIYGDGPDWETAHKLSLRLKTIGQQNEPIRKQTTMSQYFSNRI